MTLTEWIAAWTDAHAPTCAWVTPQVLVARTFKGLAIKCQCQAWGIYPELEARGGLPKLQDRKVEEQDNGT